MNQINLPRRQSLVAASTGVAAHLLGNRAWAQTPGSSEIAAYPSRPIRWLVPFAAGGGTDAVARLLAQYMTPMLNQQPFVIENRPGAQTLVATQMLVTSKPDGYTIASGTDSLPVNEHLLAKVPYSINDILPISIFVKSPMVLVTPPHVAGTGAADLFRYMRANDGKLAFGTWGIGTTSHLASEILSERLNVKMTHIPYAGAAPAAAAMLGDQLQVMWGDLPTVAPFVKEGKLKAWALSTKVRSTLLVDVAPLADQGMPDFDMFAFNGLIAPKATPAPVVQRLSNAVRQAFGMAEVREAIIARGFTPWGSTPEEFQEQIKKDSALAKRIIDSRNLRIS
jgi:tripartite-type tricarboxylate transporter receptor subunit TctC